MGSMHSGRKVAVVLICLVIVLASGALVVVLGNQSSANDFASQLSIIKKKALYAHASFGIVVYDPANNRTLYSENEGSMFVPGSTTKLFTSATAFDALGADHRFHTPVHAIGTIIGEKLEGDLVLVASGDITMGGRTTASGGINFTNVDHGDANALGGCQLTSEDPLAGLDSLAEQVNVSGITEVDDVIVDPRAFPVVDIGKSYKIAPIAINDDLIDVMIAPTHAGQKASVDWRPKTAIYSIDANVTTLAIGPTEISVTDGAPGVIKVRGTIAANSLQANFTYSISDPLSFARTLFIEALQCHGVQVHSNLSGSNPEEKLPSISTYTVQNRVAELVSPRFAEDVKLTLKVSQNLHADTYLGLIAMAKQAGNYYQGLGVEGQFLERLGLNLTSISLGDGEGGVSNDRISPLAARQLLVAMMERTDFQDYFLALPILGVDGSLAGSATPGSKAIGHVYAKTGTTVDENPLSGSGIALAKALAGYVDTASGKRLVFAIYVNNVPVGSVDDIKTLGSDVAHISELIYASF